MRLRQHMTAIHGIPKNGMRAIQLRSHAGMLRSLTGKHESDRRIAAALQARSRSSAVVRSHAREVLFQLCGRPSGCGKAKGKLASANVSGVANITDRCLGIVLQPLQKLLDMRHQRVGAFGGKGNQARRIRSGDWFVVGAVGGASSRTAKAFVPPIPRLFSPARRGVSVTGKILELGVYVEWRGREIDCEG